MEARFEIAPNQVVTQVCSANPQEETGEEFDWKTASVCHAVYEAVLAGVHRDKVSDEIVANIIDTKARKKIRSDQSSVLTESVQSFSNQHS
ncbi:MAG: hypothetical protein ACKVHR_16705 [Pirellulales bacterium]